MKIAGKNVLYGEKLTNTQKNYLQQRVSALARLLHGKGYKVKMKTSASTDSIYLDVNNIQISFRNHAGKNAYFSVIISSFPNWTEAKKYVLNNIIPKCTPPEKLEYNFLGDVDVQFINESDKETKRKEKEIEKQALLKTGKIFENNEKVLDYLKAIERNTNSMLNSFGKIPKDFHQNGNLVHVHNLVRNTQKQINKLKTTVN